MGYWDDYKREEREETVKITGKARCVITDVEESTSKKTGNPMIVITVRPSGTRATVKTWLVKNEYFNRNATQFFDAFPEIRDGDFNFLAWVGCEGAAMFDLDEQGYMKVKYFIDAVKAADLPPFEGDKPQKQTITSLDDSDDSDELPFM
jgi:hypothetical protein